MGVFCVTHITSNICWLLWRQMGWAHLPYIGKGLEDVGGRVSCMAGKLFTQSSSCYAQKHSEHGEWSAMGVEYVI